MTSKQARIYAATLATSVSLLGLLLTLFDNWKRIVPGSQAQVFGDLNIVTTTAGCLTEPMGSDVRGNPCSLWVADMNSYPPEPYNYPSFWFKGLAIFGVTGEHTLILGASLIVLFSLALGILAFLTLETRGSKTKVMLLLGTAILPPGLLAMERGNTDIFVFFILAIGVLFLTKGNSWLSMLAYSVSAIIKIFPFGAVIALTQAGKNRLLKIVVALFLISAGVYSYWPEVSLIAERTPQATYPAFGSPALPTLASSTFFSMTLDSWAGRTIGFLLFALTTAIGYLTLVWESKSPEPDGRLKKNWKLSIDTLREDFVSRVLFLSGSGAFCFTYLLGMNFDYRGIFLYPVIFSLIRVAGRRHALDFLTISLLICLSLFNFPFGPAYLADVMLFFLVPILTIAALQISLLLPNKR